MLKIMGKNIYNYFSLIFFVYLNLWVLHASADPEGAGEARGLDPLENEKLI